MHLNKDIRRASTNKHKREIYGLLMIHMIGGILPSKVTDQFVALPFSLYGNGMSADLGKMHWRVTFVNRQLLFGW